MKTVVHWLMYVVVLSWNLREGQLCWRTSGVYSLVPLCTSTFSASYVCLIRYVISQLAACCHVLLTMVDTHSGTITQNKPFSGLLLV